MERIEARRRFFADLITANAGVRFTGEVDQTGLTWLLYSSRNTCSGSIFAVRRAGR